MVRKKAGANRKPSIFAPPGKVLMMEKNRATLTPLKTPKSSKTASFQSPNRTHNKSSKSLSLKSPNETTKKRKISSTLRAIREIKKFQGSTRLLVPRAPFSRVVKEIAQNILGRTDIRFTALSLSALQEATEMAMVNLLEIANLCCIHAKRVTLTPADIRLTRRAFGLANPLNG